MTFHYSTGKKNPFQTFPCQCFLYIVESSTLVAAKEEPTVVADNEAKHESDLDHLPDEQLAPSFEADVSLPSRFVVFIVHGNVSITHFEHYKELLYF